MKLKSLLLLTALSAGIQASAQLGPWSTDTVYMGNGYANDVYYHMSNGAVKTEANNNWHLAFAAGVVGRSVAVFANHTPGNVNVYPLHKSSGSFGTDLTGDTTAAKTKTLYNSIESYETGAFNMNADPSDPFDYGWGSYDMSTHFVYGDSLYFIKTPQGKYQFWIETYKSTPTDSLSWTFHIADIDGGNRKDKKVYLKPYLSNLFVYYSITGDNFFAREPATNTWDVVFTRYSQVLSGAGYPTTGVMSNYGVKVAELRKISADTAQYRDYPLDSSITAIGSDWKIPPMGPPSPSFQLDTVTYFVVAKNSSIYQLEFLFASQSAYGGKVALRKRMSVPLSVQTVPGTRNTLSVFPNPASANTNLLIDVQEAGKAQIVITDMNGRAVQYQTVNMSQGLNAYQINTSAFATGSYFITITNGSWKISDKLIIQ